MDEATRPILAKIHEAQEHPDYAGFLTLTDDELRALVDALGAKEREVTALEGELRKAREGWDGWQAQGLAAIDRADEAEAALGESRKEAALYKAIIEDSGVTHFVDELAASRKQKADLAELLRRIRRWDHLPLTGDGPYWMREIDAALASVGLPDQENT